ncbi:MAG TPA: hypothetical protein VGL97_10785 [Bryobacteraceae bacterium]|jgi:hypothetical protein
MKHLSEEQLTLAYYGDLASELQRHLAQCPECQAGFESMKGLLDSLPEYPVPERSESYGAEVWARLLPQLPVRRVRPSWLNWWTMVPALATLALVAFFAGMLTQRHRQPETAGIPAAARERVLLMAMSDHLDRSQILLSELVHGSPGEAGERQRARDLLDENRLLRATAMSAGDTAHAALLDELERVLLDVANNPGNLSPGELDLVRNRIEGEGLLFKVRIMSSNVRSEGQKL